MFGIGGGEFILIILIALMLFGSDKIPEMARTFGKGMAQLKNATNEIKSEIQKGAEANGIDTSIKELTSTFTDEVEKVKSGIDTNILPEVAKAKEGIEEAVGPVKRHL